MTHLRRKDNAAAAGGIDPIMLPCTLIGLYTPSAVMKNIEYGIRGPIIMPVKIAWQGSNPV